MEYSSTHEGSCPHGDCPPGSSPTKTLGLLSAEDFASEFVVPGQYGSAGLILYGGKRRMPTATHPPRSCLAHSIERRPAALTRTLRHDT